VYVHTHTCTYAHTHTHTHTHAHTHYHSLHHSLHHFKTIQLHTALTLDCIITPLSFDHQATALSLLTTYIHTCTYTHTHTHTHCHSLHHSQVTQLQVALALDCVITPLSSDHQTTALSLFATYIHTFAYTLTHTHTHCHSLHHSQMAQLPLALTNDCIITPLSSDHQTTALSLLTTYIHTYTYTYTYTCTCR